MSRQLRCVLFAFIALVFTIQSCTIKRDCKGRVKHRLSNGVWI